MFSLKYLISISFDNIHVRYLFVICWFPDEGILADCEASSILHDLSVAVTCTFSFRVDSFDVLWNNSKSELFFTKTCFNTKKHH